MNKKAAQTIAKQIAQEPLEVLKDIKEQITEGEIPQAGEEEKIKDSNPQNEIQDKIKSIRRMEAYQRELTDIKRENLFKELQRRIAQGEEVPLEDYPELSLDQKQVLKAQAEAVKARSQQPALEGQLIEPAAKKSRRLFNFGRKQEVKRQQQRVENIVPPSG